MTSRLPSFEKPLCEVPEEKRHLLDSKVKNNRHLANFARELNEWRELLPYLFKLLEGDGEEAEDTIVEDFRKTKRRRLVHCSCLALWIVASGLPVKFLDSKVRILWVYIDESCIARPNLEGRVWSTA